MATVNSDVNDLVEVQVVCAWCGLKMHTKLAQRNMLADVSHGICSTCRNEVIQQFKDELARRNKSD